MSQAGLRLCRLGEVGLLLQLPEDDGDRILGLTQAIEQKMAEGAFPGMIELVPGLQSVSLLFDPLTSDPESWRESLLTIAAARPLARHAGRDREISVCFDDDFAPDLPELAARRQMTPEEFIACFLAVKLRVRMMGFLPGFAYLGTLPQLCRAPRRATPRASLPPGSLAIAGAFCAIYPWRSPGGWNLIGRSPQILFDPGNERAPAWLQSGDRIIWRRIDRAQFESEAHG